MSPLAITLSSGRRSTKNSNRTRKGIKIRRHFYKLSQFADDTTLILGNKREIPLAFKAIGKWCRATGMLENKTKREGLKMGRYRHTNIDQNIKWAKDGEWCISLGVPIGNELDTSKWWKKRIEAVQAKSERWKGLYRSSYFGRNLIVQAIYFGSLRYWLFSIYMEKEILQIVQRDADQLWWSKEPDLQKPPVRFRRFVAKLTAIGTRSKGGLKNMDWESHTQGFYAQWIVRYVHPSKASWKTLLDDLLLENVKGDQNFPEGRAILFCPMTKRDKLKMLRGLPRNAKYFRKCLDAHWKCGIKQNFEVKDNIGSEFLWRNWRFEIQADHHLRRYVSTTLETFQLSDKINKTTNDLFTLNEWKRWIAYLHEQQLHNAE